MFKLKNQLKDSFFDDIYGMKLDKWQRKVVLDNSNHLLVIASAGSGKTLTIVAKVKYLIEKKKVYPKDILCLSFTNETVNNLKNKIPYDIDVFTFHKLALNILKGNNFLYHIATDSLLNYIVDEYFFCMDYLNNYKDLLEEYFDYQINNQKIILLKMKLISFIKKIKYYMKLVKK